MFVDKNHIINQFTMPKIILNSNTLISLLKLSAIHILKELYSYIHIPVAVFNEIEKEKGKPYYQDLTKFEWIKIIEIEDKLAPLYFHDLDAGEAEAIVLANEINADLIITDEIVSRNYAKRADFKVAETIDILKKAKASGLVKEFASPFLQGNDEWLGNLLIPEMEGETK